MNQTNSVACFDGGRHTIAVQPGMPFMCTACAMTAGEIRAGEENNE